MANGENPSDAASERFRVGTDDVVILPMVAIALIVKTVVRSAWRFLKHIIDFLFPILLQLMRFPLFTLRILGDGIVALLQGIARIDKPAFSFQGHPEASPGPQEMGAMFDRFVHLMLRRLQQKLRARTSGKQPPPDKAA